MTPEPLAHSPSKPRKPAWTPLLVFFLVFTIPVTATVLLANGGRNLMRIAAMLNIDLAPRQETTVVKTGRAETSSARPAILARSFAASDAVRILPMTPDRTPEETCLGLKSISPSADPVFTPASGGAWECTATAAFADTSNSIFLQIRGADRRVGLIRIKYNLLDPSHLGEMFNQSMQLVRHVRPEVDTADLAEIENVMGAGQEKYIMYGLDRVILKQEMMDSRRYNLLIATAG